MSKNTRALVHAAMLGSALLGSIVDDRLHLDAAAAVDRPGHR